MNGSNHESRKSKVWQFLLWLKENNILYHNIKLDPELMELYTNNDDTLPGITERVIYDHQSDPNMIFEEETAGFTSHPASSIHYENCQFDHQVLLESMGMSDPECACINGQTFTAAALWNLIPRKVMFQILQFHMVM